MKWDVGTESVEQLNVWKDEDTSNEWNETRTTLIKGNKRSIDESYNLTAEYMHHGTYANHHADELEIAQKH